MLLKKLTAVGNRTPSHIFIPQHHRAAYVLSRGAADLSTVHQRADMFLTAEEKQLTLGIKQLISPLFFLPVSYRCYPIF